MWGTSVSGPLKIVNEDNLPGMYRSASQATFELPGASYEASTAGLPLMSTSLCADFCAKSGIPCKISRIVADCDDNRAASGSLLPEPDGVEVPTGVYVVGIGDAKGGDEGEAVPQLLNGGGLPSER